MGAGLDKHRELYRLNRGEYEQIYADRYRAAAGLRNGRLEGLFPPSV